ncbi:hypothetical protein FGO68_gene1133 [Halteria grandinella]|uniref:Cyclin C-terminal domain-containing protein n=1 Tax=Halteria grandinella TaxID=5974 RepID=A0A8J8NDY8_HALGN|nr:hypothetical protein FGO68_gene1133 [Halteria grandinella]
MQRKAAKLGASGQPLSKSKTESNIRVPLHNHTLRSRPQNLPSKETKPLLQLSTSKDDSTLIMTGAEAHKEHNLSGLLGALSITQEESPSYFDPFSQAQKHLDTECNLKQFYPEMAQSMLTDLVGQEKANGLHINPYKKGSKQLIASHERAKIIEVLIVTAQSAGISDYALINGIYIFDKVMEGVKVKGGNLRKIEGNEFKIAAICLYLSAKFEDPKYPYFECYKNLILDKTRNKAKYYDQIAHAWPQHSTRSSEDLLDLELFIFKSLHYNLNQPISLKYYERFARCAFPPDSPTSLEDTALGLFLLFIACFYPGLHFNYPQSLLAAAAVHLTLRIRDSQWIWSDYLHREVTGYAEYQLRECSHRMVKKYVGLMVKDGERKKYWERLWLVERKFGGDGYYRVSAVRPRTEGGGGASKQSREIMRDKSQ